MLWMFTLLDPRPDLPIDLDACPTSPLLVHALVFVDATSRNDHRRISELLDAHDGVLVAVSAVSSKHVLRLVVWCHGAGPDAEVPGLYKTY